MVVFCSQEKDKEWEKNKRKGSKLNANQAFQLETGQYTTKGHITTTSTHAWTLHQPNCQNNKEGNFKNWRGS
jgi:hypothetical protein